MNFTTHKRTSSVFGYDPFGMLLVGRSWEANYTYGFNGKEMDDEILGEGNIYDFGARIFDSRLAKFFSVDNKFRMYSWQSGYAYFKNSPIAIIDYKGEGGIEDEDSEKPAVVISNRPNKLKFIFAVARIWPLWWGENGKKRAENFWCECKISCNIYKDDKKELGLDFSTVEVTKYKIKTEEIQAGQQPVKWDEASTQIVVLDPTVNYEIQYDHHQAADNLTYVDNNGNTVSTGTIAGEGVLVIPPGTTQIRITVTPGPITPTRYNWKVVGMPKKVNKTVIRKISIGDWGLFRIKTKKSKPSYTPGKDYERTKKEGEDKTIILRK